MPYNEFLADRIAQFFTKKSIPFEAKKMMGGLCFMVDDKMCFGTYNGGLMVRVDPEEVDSLISRKSTEQMIHGGRPMKGYLFVEPEGYDLDNDLEFWVAKCLDFNPKAKSSFCP